MLHFCYAPGRTTHPTHALGTTTLGTLTMSIFRSILQCRTYNVSVDFPFFFFSQCNTLHQKHNFFCFGPSMIIYTHPTGGLSNETLTPGLSHIGPWAVRPFPLYLCILAVQKDPNSSKTRIFFVPFRGKDVACQLFRYFSCDQVHVYLSESSHNGFQAHVKQYEKTGAFAPLPP